KSSFDSSKANQRLVVVVDGHTFASTYGDNAIAEANKLRDSSNDRLMFEGVKFFSDDGLLSFSMQIQNPGYIHSDRY
ncbi:hypothetical protein LNK20_22205, partial [Bacillus safensis]|nr:hypothetical protein [Bacillus safensis]